MRYPGLSQETLANTIKDDPASLYADFGFFSLVLWGGLTYLDLGTHSPQKGYYQQARDLFAQIEQPAHALVVPERTRVEITSHLATTAVKQENLESFLTYLESGITGANTLGSKLRRQEAVAAFREARQV